MLIKLILQSAFLSMFAAEGADGNSATPPVTAQLAPAPATPSSINREVSKPTLPIGSSWEFGVPSPSHILDQESDGAPNLGTLLSEKLAPDPRSVFSSEENGNKMGLIGQADEMCLGGLIARINRRAVNYGFCGALFGATAGCFLAILPVYLCNDQIQTVGDQANVTPPDITVLAIPAALIGTPPGCALGAGTGATAGVISAFLFPHEPSPKSSEGGDGSEGSDGSEGELGEDEGENENEHSVIRKKRKPKPRKKPRGTSRDNNGSDAREGDHGTEHRTDAEKADRVRKEDRDANKPSVRDSKQPSGDRLKRDEKVEDENKPEVPKDSESVKKKKNRKAKNPDKKPSKAKLSEGEIDPNNKSGDPLSSDQ